MTVTFEVHRHAFRLPSVTELSSEVANFYTKSTSIKLLSKAHRMHFFISFLENFINNCRTVDCGVIRVFRVQSTVYDCYTKIAWLMIKCTNLKAVSMMRFNLTLKRCRVFTKCSNS